MKQQDDTRSKVQESDTTGDDQRTKSDKQKILKQDFITVPPLFAK